MTTSEGPILLDTNILVYAADEISPFYRQCRKFRERGQSGELSLCVAPQMLFEFYAVVTDPRRVAKALDPQEAWQEVESYLNDTTIRKIYPGMDIAQNVLTFLKRYRAGRQEVFDLVIVATMLSNSVQKICTYNQSHFSRYQEIQPLLPDEN